MYLTIVLILGSLSVLCTTIVLSVYHRSEDDRIPESLQKFTTAVLMKVALHGRANCRSKPKKTNKIDTTSKSDLFEDKDARNIPIHHDTLLKEDTTVVLTWQMISKILDAAFFNVFLLVMVCTTLWFAIIVTFNGN